MNSASSWSEKSMDNKDSKNHSESLNSSYQKDLDMIKEQIHDQDLNEEAEIAKLRKEF